MLKTIKVFGCNNDEDIFRHVTGTLRSKVFKTRIDITIQLNQTIEIFFLISISFKYKPNVLYLFKINVFMCTIKYSIFNYSKMTQKFNKN